VKEGKSNGSAKSGAIINAKLREQRDVIRRRRDESRAVNAKLREQREVIRRRRDESRSINAKLREQRDALRRQNLIVKGRINTVKLQKDLLREKNQVLESKVAGFAICAKLVQSVANGNSFFDAALIYTRSALGERHRLICRSFAQKLQTSDSTRVVGCLCSAIHAASDGFYRNALGLFQEVGELISLKYAPVEYIESLLHEKPTDAGLVLERVVNDDVSIRGEDLFFIAQKTIAAKRFDVAKLLMQKVNVSALDLSDRDQEAANWLIAEYGRRSELRELPDDVDPSVPQIALLDYKMLDYHRVSGNAGDYIQTIAMMSNLVRFVNVDFQSNVEGLAEWVNGLRDRLDPSYSIENTTGKVNLTLLDRDAASSRKYRVPTWAIAFGWYMHPQCKGGFDFPFDESILPIFISFHVNNRSMLTNEVVDYLKQYQPIGCRDWTTVYALREYDIDAFFSGCMTTTIGKVFKAPEHSNGGQRKTALVDFIGNPLEFKNDDCIEFTQVGPDVKNSDMITNLNAARDLLDGYREYHKIVTSRLHCYLPCKSIGLDVVFRPKNDADVRFEGLAHLRDTGNGNKLTELDDASFLEMREGIESKLEVVLQAIMSRKTQGEVYDIWRRACAKDLEVAERYCSELPDRPQIGFDLDACLNRIQQGKLISGDFSPSRVERVNVAFAVDDQMSEVLPVVLESLVANCSKRARVYIMARHLERSYFERIIEEFNSDLDLCFFDFSFVNYGENLQMLKHTTESTMDRLLLPELLKELDDVLYLDSDIIIKGDLSELAELDVSSYKVAGRLSTVNGWKYGWEMAYRASARLTPEKAWEQRRRLSLEGSLDFNTFNAGVIIMNLRMMREDGFTRKYLPYIEGYAMNDQDALNMYARSNRLELEHEWNAVPSQDNTDSAKIIHYAGPIKPWDEKYILRKEDYQYYEKKYATRRGVACFVN
jgi:lipopolysaccharide biosynthesis glycosyltransferase